MITNETLAPNEGHCYFRRNKNELIDLITQGTSETLAPAQGRGKGFKVYSFFFNFPILLTYLLLSNNKILLLGTR